MISVNLLPEEERILEGRFGGAPRWGVVLPIVLSCAILLPLGGMVLMQRTKIANLKEDIARTQVEKARLAPQVQLVQDLVSRQRELRDRLRVLRDLGRNRTEMVRVVDELARHIPENLWLTKFSLNPGGGYRLEGTTFSNLLVADLMGRLESSDLFYKVDLVESKRDLLGEEPIIKFAILFTLTDKPVPNSEGEGS
ncbi:MAG: PilN domain-containing protein [Candidatus Eisenbacteria bacterium]|uniref:PilN domain-containing protein n=1 Tax=Eiseniibacteriota bacterium TaxID=2212470 RepID=A0A948W3T3_UNCEI|nr:PilN domain-containing protein [Candidatus Eisenbacteria bacterium]MBU1948016.1 PilN domain-containing protein [Candidatus Eisenbacteria bacterium]MBU2691447.1 PilN domain-containing protein [Candidatus Eisenbacteria bacterium]